MGGNYLSIKLRGNHKFLSSSGLIRQICEPLRHLKIHMMTYLKNFHDGSQINLSTHPNWISDYYELGLYATSTFQSVCETHQPGFKLWPTESSLQVFQHGREYFDSYYGLTYCYPQSDGCEFFFFSTSAKNYQQLEFYWNNLDLLEQFIAYFRHQAASILKDCNDSRLLLPSQMSPQTQPQSIALITPMGFINERNDFLQAIRPKALDSLSIWLQQFEALTPRERACLDLLLEEPTATGIAGRLSISKRTVETYLEQIKAKLNCRTKQELIIKLSTYSARSI